MNTYNIKTAPKDGTHILLHFTKTHECDAGDWEYSNNDGWIDGWWVKNQFSGNGYWEVV